jgi:hypothetical protein
MNAQAIGFLTQEEFESAKFKGGTKTEVKGCGKAMSRDKLL